MKKTGICKKEVFTPPEKCIVVFKSSFFLFLLFACGIAGLLAQGNDSTDPKKYALVIGNGNYAGLSRLANPVNDANDVADALGKLGFTVDRLYNASQEQMDNAVMRLKNRLSVSQDAYGFLFYAGHGVQSNGENFLIPVDANIPGENHLRSRAVSVQVILDDLNDAGNGLNVIVLDACRDNPFGWSRSGTRGLAVVGRQPADSIIVYATSAGQRASDGEGRNGLFTAQLLKNIEVPGLEVKDMLNRTGSAVSQASNRQQIPAIYNQFFGEAYLGSRPVAPVPLVFEAGAANIATGSLEIHTVTGGTVEIVGMNINQSVDMPAWGSLPIERINAGSYRVVMRYDDGKTEEKSIEVGREQSAKVEFQYRPPAPKPEPMPVQPRQPRQPKPPVERQPIAPEAARLNTIGASVGSSFAAPWVVGTVEGTIAPWKYSFFGLGMDVGLVSGAPDLEHLTLYPFARYALFVPFDNTIGWYAGAGAGYMYTSYALAGEGEASEGSIVADFSTGFILGGITVSYSIRTDFNSASNKFAVGYLYRFK